MEISLIGKGSDTILADFSAVGLTFARRTREEGVVYNSGERYELVRVIAGAVPWVSIAAVLSAWIRARSSRKISLTLADNKIVHLDTQGIPVSEIEKLLPLANQILVMETKKPETSADDV